MALSRVFHNLVPLARNERLPVIVLKKGVDKSILVDARVVQRCLFLTMIIRHSYDKSSNLTYNDYQYNRYNQNIFTGLFLRIFSPVIVVPLKKLTGDVPSKPRRQRLKLCIFVNKTFNCSFFTSISHAGRGRGYITSKSSDWKLLNQIRLLSFQGSRTFLEKILG